MAKTIRELEIDAFETEPLHYLKSYLNGNKTSVVNTLRILKGTIYYDAIMLQFVDTPELYKEIIKRVNG